MSCLDATFTLTPRSPRYYSSWDQQSNLQCYGADFVSSGWDLSTLYGIDSFFFDTFTAADPNADYTVWNLRMRVPFLDFSADLRALGTAKSLALVFGFQTLPGLYGPPARVLIYTDAKLISDQTLAYTDSQLLLEIESLDNPVHLYFIHAGGSWLFKGLSGYVV